MENIGEFGVIRQCFTLPVIYSIGAYFDNFVLELLLTLHCFVLYDKRGTLLPSEFKHTGIFTTTHVVKLGREPQAH